MADGDIIRGRINIFPYSNPKHILIISKGMLPKVTTGSKYFSND